MCGCMTRPMWALEDCQEWHSTAVDLTAFSAAAVVKCVMCAKNGQ